MDELRSGGVKTVHINGDGSLVLFCDGSEAAGKWVEMKQSGGEGVSEAVNEIEHEIV